MCVVIRYPCGRYKKKKKKLYDGVGQAKERDIRCSMQFFLTFFLRLLYNACLSPSASLSYMHVKEKNAYKKKDWPVFFLYTSFYLGDVSLQLRGRANIHILSYIEKRLYVHSFLTFLFPIYSPLVYPLYFYIRRIKYLINFFFLVLRNKKEISY